MKRMLWCVLAILAGTAGAAAGQEGAAGGPMTYALARKANYVPLETLRETRSRIPAPLARQVTIEREGVLLQQVLLDIANQAELGLSYGEDLVRARVVVSLSAKAETAADALQQVTDGTDWAVLVTPTGQVAVLRREPAQVGVIAGSVSDKKTGSSLAGATVVVEGASLSATTGTDGRYRIAEVPAGTYTVRARFIGYAPGAASVTVNADEEATADLVLDKSVQRLDEVVTTGTFVPTEVKALPTPITVISDSDIALQRPHTVQELFRQVVPTAVSWDLAGLPVQTAFSVRGVSSLSGGAGQMKVFVDGIPLASLTVAAIDPSSIARIETIRGPQAAAIYGSDAIGGVIQIFTKRGNSTLIHPEVDGEVALGLIQTPYASYGEVLRQAYSASVRGGGADVSYNFGAGYTHTADWAAPISAQSNPSAYGGVHITRGMLTADVTGRYDIQNNPALFNPDLAQTGFVGNSKPNYEPVQYRFQTVGARVSLAPTRWWQHTLTVGVDHHTNDAAQAQPRLTTPSDTLLVALNFDETKTSIGYNTSVQGAFVPGVIGSLTVGFDHYSLPVTSWFTGGALNTTGNIATDPGSPVSATRTITNNTGYFSQGRLAIHDALFLTGGLRAEQNSDFGDSLGTPVSPQVGLSYAQTMGTATIKVRGSWGRAIRAPTPDAKTGLVGVGFVQLANPLLGPERQRGWDAGVDVALGVRGSLSVTYYNQTAENLIQNVLLSTDPVFASQNQNVARVKNSGVEVEGTVFASPVELKAQYGYVRSRIEDLGPNYTGDLQVGDQPLFTPAHTAGASLTVVPLRGTTLAAGLSYVSSWTAYDRFAQLRCRAHTGPCQATLRDYHTTIPGFVKANVTVSQQLTPLLSAFVSLDNVANNTAHEFSVTQPVMGRITTVGVHFHR